jgi:hypothetical protein
MTDSVRVDAIVTSVEPDPEAPLDLLVVQSRSTQPSRYPSMPRTFTDLLPASSGIAVGDTMHYDLLPQPGPTWAEHLAGWTHAAT